MSIEFERDLDMEGKLVERLEGPIVTHDLLEKDTYSKTDNNDNSKLADVVYVFCPGYDKGIMFYTQSLSRDGIKIVESLSEGKLLSSGEKIVEWNNEINGIRDNNVPVNSQTSFLVNSQMVRVHDSDSHGAITIIVSYNNFVKILGQIEKPVINQDENYKLIDFNSRIVDYKEINNFTLQEEIDNKKR